MQIVKAWPIDPLVFKSFKLEVSEKLPTVPAHDDHTLQPTDITGL